MRFQILPYTHPSSTLSPLNPPPLNLEIGGGEERRTKKRNKKREGREREGRKGGVRQGEERGREEQRGRGSPSKLPDDRFFGKFKLNFSSVKMFKYQQLMDYKRLKKANFCELNSKKMNR